MTALKGLTPINHQLLTDSLHIVGWNPDNGVKTWVPLLFSPLKGENKSPEMQSQVASKHPAAFQPNDMTSGSILLSSVLQIQLTCNKKC